MIEAGNGITSSTSLTTYRVVNNMKSHQWKRSATIRSEGEKEKERDKKETRERKEKGTGGGKEKQKKDRKRGKFNPWNYKSPSVCFRVVISTSQLPGVRIISLDRKFLYLDVFRVYIR